MHRITVLTLIAVAITLAAPAHAGATTSKNSSMCTTPAYRQFDFFVGDWDAYDLMSKTSSKVVARDKVSVILNGCVVLEDYRQGDGHHGESFSLYDAVTGSLAPELGDQPR